MSLVLYYSPGACSGVTINAIEELGLECEYRKIELSTGAHKTEEYLKINPFGKVPALVKDGQLLTENPAILIYLNSLTTDARVIPDTDDAYQRSLYYSDLMWLSSSVHPSVRHVCMPGYYTLNEDTTDVVAKGRLALTNYLKMADDRLATSKFWYGDEWAIVDTYLHWCYTRAEKGGFALDDFPALIAHRQRVEQKPSFKRRFNVEFGE
ncbi:glutathione S-transferase family protein [Vibrio sp. WJH972]